MVTQRIPGCAVVTADRYLILGFFAVDLETVLSSKDLLPIPIFKLNSQRHLVRRDDAMNLVVPEPEVPFELSKTILVIVPSAVEADRSVLSSLEHNPPAIVRLQIAVHLKICSSVRVYRVHATRVVASIQNINTSPRFVEIIKKSKLSQHMLVSLHCWENLILYQDNALKCSFIQCMT